MIHQYYSTHYPDAYYDVQGKYLGTHKLGICLLLIYEYSTPVHHHTHVKVMQQLQPVQI